MANNPINRNYSTANSMQYLRSIARYPTDPRCNACPSPLTLIKVLTQDYALSAIDNHPRDIYATATIMSDGLTDVSIKLGLAYTHTYCMKGIRQPWSLFVRTLGRIFWLDEHDHDGVIVGVKTLTEYFNAALSILDAHHQWIWDNRFCDTHDVFTANHRIKHIDG